MWQNQIDSLKRKYRVIAYDLRGQGRSDTGDGQFTLEFLVDDLIALLDKLKIEKAILCGLSMGGYISLRATERESHRVNGLILCDTKSEADTNEAKLARAATMKLIKTAGVKPLANNFLIGAFSPSSMSNRDLVRIASKIICRNKPLGLCGSLLALAGRTDTTGFLPTISVPTLILVGEVDKITPPDFSGRMQSAIKNSEMRLIAKSGHLSNMENSTEFNSCLLEFLDKRIG
jgi:pimeloyl-ACP methyl ester carboxylesterase